MEADWSVALAADDPVIAVPWTAAGAGKCRFVDLRLGSHLIDEIEEAQTRPALRSALLRLNGVGSGLWTAKCDAWTSSADQGDEPCDPYEMEAEPGETAFGAGSYIDLLPRDFQAYGCLEGQKGWERWEHWMRAVTDGLRGIPASGARVELVLRHAEVSGVQGFGVTWFVEGCGPTALRAGQRWGTALDLALAVVIHTRLGSFEVKTGDDTMTGTGE
jgi:hypothetical protein